MINKVEYEYDICLTYASEQLDYVKKVYEVLCANNVKVFFDKDNDIDTFLWGRNLIESFQDVYKNKARYCAMFISEDYAKKAWTRHDVEVLSLEQLILTIYIFYLLDLMKQLYLDWMLLYHI